MPKTVNKTDEILKKLAENGTVYVVNKPEHIEAQKEMNKIMEENRRDFQIMDKQSQISASSVILFFSSHNYIWITKH